MKYEVPGFDNADNIGVLCRGSSLINLSKVKDLFNCCFIVGQFDNALKKVGKQISKKKIVQIINKCAIQPDKKVYTKYNITDIQCNFGSYFGEKLPPEKRKLYNKIKKCNPDMDIHLVKPAMIEHRPNNLKSWPTCGVFAVDLASFCYPKTITIIGLDFYHSNYFCKEKIRAGIKSNRKRTKDMILAVYHIVEKNTEIQFNIYTTCKLLKQRKNLMVYYV